MSDDTATGRSDLRTLRVGDTAIPWRVRYSAKARRKRIVVSTAGVEVVVPAGTPMQGDGGIEAFVHRKRRWIFDAMRRMEALRSVQPEQHYASGAKMLYRGRRLTLDVEPDDVTEVVVKCRSRFDIRVPRDLPQVERPAAVRRALLEWMTDRAMRDALRWTRTYSERLAIRPPGVRLADQRTLWGSCGKDDIIRINWHLVQAPAAAMEYVVAHEVTHLVERNHTDLFWLTLGEVMPDWPDRKELLERWEREQRIEGRQV